MSKKVTPEHREEIEACFKSKSGPVYGFLRRLTGGDTELSEDVVQETFRKAAQNWHKLRDRPEEELEAWLITVAFNTARPGRSRASRLAGLGLPALGAVVFLAVAVLAVLCWVIASGERTDRVSQMMLARRGQADGPVPGAAAPPVPASRPECAGRAPGAVDVR